MNYLVWLFGLGLAQAVGAAGALYNIEMLLFEHPTTSEERWPAVWNAPDMSLAQGTIGTVGATGVRLLRYKRLTAAAKTLQDKGLPIIAHLRWQQRVAGRNNQQWYRIAEGPLQGLVRMSRGRFLHFTADWVLQGPEQEYRIALQRRMKSGETHYLDHPKLGVIVRAEAVRGKPKPKKPVKSVPPPTAPAPVQPKDTRPRALPDPG